MPRRRRTVTNTKRSCPPPPQIALGPVPIFLTLAVEVIEHIVAFLDHPRDLLSLALTSKRTLRIIIPIHLQTRLIRCDIRRTFLWNMLGSLPSVTRAHLVSLHIVDESFPLSSPPGSDAALPVFLFDPSEKQPSTTNKAEAMDQLVAVIPLLPSLKSFRLESKKTSVPPDLIAALRDSCPNLSDLRIRSNYFWSYNETQHNSVRLLDIMITGEQAAKH